MSEYLLLDAELKPDDFVIQVAPGNRWLVPEVEGMIEDSWAKLLASPSGSRFFDGGLWRYVSHHCLGNKVELVVEPTSFKVYKGTNIDHPDLFQQYGESVMANPLVVHAMVKTVDGYFLFARRSNKVALFQNHIHIIGGTVPRKMETLTGANLFQVMRDELFEETGIQASEIDSLKCVGLRLNLPYRYRSVDFTVDVTVTAAELQTRVAVDAYEHDEFIFVPANPTALTQFVQHHEREIALPVRCWIDWELNKSLSERS